MTSPGAYVAMMYRRHQYEYATPNDGLAALAINNRNNAALNDLAVLRKPITGRIITPRHLSQNLSGCWTIASSTMEAFVSSSLLGTALVRPGSRRPT